MLSQNITANTPYEKAEAEVVYFDNSDVITTSGAVVACVTWSNESGVPCHFGLTAS